MPASHHMDTSGLRSNTSTIVFVAILEVLSASCVASVYTWKTSNAIIGCCKGDTLGDDNWQTEIYNGIN